MIELPFDLSLISGFFIVIFILLYAWKSGYIKKQFVFAEAMPRDIELIPFAKLMFSNAKPFVINFLKYLAGYFLRIGWFFLILSTIYNSFEDFELTVLFAFAYTLARVSMMAKNKEGDVIVLSPAENERIRKGTAKLKDFEADK